jgi:hypothetical protein
MSGITANRGHMAEQAPPYWILISVLFSSFPLTPTLATYLHEVAFDMHQSNTAMSPLAGELFQGKLYNLKKEALLGTISGPVFEANVETERGSGTVRFLLTRQGLDWMQEKNSGPQRPPASMMN